MNYQVQFTISFHFIFHLQFHFHFISLPFIIPFQISKIADLSSKSTPNEAMTQHPELEIFTFKVNRNFNQTLDPYQHINQEPISSNSVKVQDKDRLKIPGDHQQRSLATPT
jgi:hypothetical protein